MTNSLDQFIRHDLMKLPILASEHGREVDNLILYVHWLMGALFVGWMAYFVFVLFRFRRARNPRADYVGIKNHASNYIEAAVVIAEAVLLLGFAIPLWTKAVDKFPDPSKATVLRVTAEQFTWNSRYPGPDGAFGKQDIKFLSATNDLALDYSDPNVKDDIRPRAKNIHVPVNKPAIIHVTSKDVIHCFKVVPLRVTQDAIPGLSIPVHFVPNRVGNYQITCAQLCGNGHSQMNGFFTVDSPEDYNKWLTEQATSQTATSFE
jgi:cytochrome c oxidase subunit 2